MQNITPGHIRLALVFFMAIVAAIGFFMKMIPSEFMTGLISGVIMYYFGRNEDGSQIQALGTRVNQLEIQSTPKQILEERKKHYNDVTTKTS